MDDELRDRLFDVIRREVPAPIYRPRDPRPATDIRWAVADAVLAEIGRTHAIVSLGDDKAGGLLRCEYEYDVLSFE